MASPGRWPSRLAFNPCPRLELKVRLYMSMQPFEKIVAQHGGTVTAQRNPERGMTFSLALPLHQRRKS